MKNSFKELVFEITIIVCIALLITMLVLVFHALTGYPMQRLEEKTKNVPVNYADSGNSWYN